MNRYHIFKKFSDSPFKSYDFCKFNIYNTNRKYKYFLYFCLCPSLLRWWQAAALCKKPVTSRIAPEKNRFVRFYLPLLWGTDQRQNLGGGSVPVAATRQTVFSG
jgi:hypothetical protein